ncbi:hypothetical protein [Phormidium nigroviride]
MGNTKSGLVIPFISNNPSLRVARNEATALRLARNDNKGGSKAGFGIISH